MPRPLVYLLYNLLLPVALLLGFPSFVIKGIRRGGLARNFRQRLGLFRRETLDEISGKNPIWIHAVSVGEIFIALKIIEAIQARSPEKHIVLSTTTTTGYAVAEEKASQTLTVIHNPLDLPWVSARVIRTLDPCGLVLIEAEIWPNLVRQLKRRGISVQLINARLSPRSGRRYQKFLPLIEPIFSQLDAVTVPFDADRERWSALGIPEERIHVLGSVKFDSTSDSEATDEKSDELYRWLLDNGFPEGNPILLGASTHRGEEALLATVSRTLRSEIPNLELVIIPRHAERATEIASQLEELGFEPILRAKVNRVESPTRQGEETRDCSNSDTSKAKQNIWISNTTGELRAWFPLASVVVVGKSFCGVGGQNPVEPILAGKPVVVGPNMQNFSDVVTDLIAAEGICQLASSEDLPKTLSNLFLDSASGTAMAKRGAEAMDRHRGAAGRSAAFLLEQIEPGFDESLAGQTPDRPAT